MDEVRVWMESLGWQALYSEVVGQEVLFYEEPVGYHYERRTWMDNETAGKYYACRDEYPFGPPRF